MFLSDQLVYLELQKTGGSHIGRLLEQYVDGQTEGKHHRLTQNLSHRYIAGSIRNPWDWYVSLWAFGCANKGSIRLRTGRRFDLYYYREGLPVAMGKKRLSPGELAISVYTDLTKPVSLWQQTYRDSSDPEGFRAWLTLLLDPGHRFDIGEGYGFSPLSLHTGLLGYRYFRLFSLGDSIYTDERLASYNGLAEFDRQMNLVNGVIRTESLEDDFIRVLSEAGISLTAGQLDEIRHKQKKTNISKRHAAGYYYDDATIRLVADKERYLITKYSYSPPVLESEGDSG